MPSNKLFDDNASDEEEVSFKTQNQYAKRYDSWREKEEMHKLEQKYGDKALNSDASLTSDSEDDEPPEIPEQIEEQFLKTLSLLKTKDPRIYDPNFKCFDDLQENKGEEEQDKVEVTKAKKPVTSLAAAFADSDDDDDAENGSQIFKVEKKAPEKKPEKKEDKIKDFLTGKIDHVDENVEKDLAPLKALWSDPKLNEGEAFLRDYILNKRYLEEGETDTANDKLLDDEALEADEKIVEEQGKFERAYNFRFEEPDQEYLKRYPRTMNYIRPKDDKRSRKRAEVKTRKEEEKKKKMEEIARLKALKLKEIQEKIAKIKEVTGNEELAFKEEDIEGDFDPEEHDRRMKAIFDEQYYGEADDQKPVFPDLDEELEIENWENYEECGEQTQQDEPHCEDEDFNMDADYDPNKARQTLLEEIQETLGKKRRNRKKKSKLAKLLAAEKPKFVPTATEKSYAEYMEEYYKMDCEDVIGGDLPTRFKYREVVPNDFGLTVEEILLADDKELNRWASLKKAVRYRAEHVERSEVNTYAAKAADQQLKKKILPSLFSHLPDEPEVVVPVESTKKKKNKQNVSEESTLEANNSNETESNNNTQNGEPDQSVNNDTSPKKKKKKKNKKNRPNDSTLGTNEDVNATTNEIEPNSFSSSVSNDAPSENVSHDSSLKKKKKSKNKNATHLNETDNVVMNESILRNNQNKNTDVKKEKRKSQNGFIVETAVNVTPSQVSDDLSKIVKEKHRNTNESNNRNNLKRKLENGNSVPSKKMKKNKDKNKPGAIEKHNKLKQKPKWQNKEKSTDPLAKLSDERLKAYGLNPKKYRNFLKYKKT